MVIMMAPNPGKKNFWVMNNKIVADPIKEMENKFVEIGNLWNEFLHDLKYMELIASGDSGGFRMYGLSRGGLIPYEYWDDVLGWSDPNGDGYWFNQRLPAVKNIADIRDLERNVNPWQNCKDVSRWMSDTSHTLVDINLALYYSRNEMKWVNNNLLTGGSGGTADKNGYWSSGKTLWDLFEWWQKGVKKSQGIQLNLDISGLFQVTEEIAQDIPPKTEVLEEFVRLKPNLQFGQMEGYTMGFFGGHSFYVPTGYMIDEELTYRVHAKHKNTKDYILLARTVQHKSDRVKSALKGIGTVLGVIITSAAGKYIANYYAKQLGLYQGPRISMAMEPIVRYGSPSKEALRKIAYMGKIGSWTGAQMGYVMANQVREQFYDRQRFLYPRRYAAGWGTYIWYPEPQNVERFSFWDDFTWKRYFISSSIPAKDFADRKTVTSSLFNLIIKSEDASYKEIFEQYPIISPWTKQEIDKSIELLNYYPEISKQYEQWLAQQGGY